MKLWRKRWGTQHLKIQTFPNKTKGWKLELPNSLILRIHTSELPPSLQLQPHFNHSYLIYPFLIIKYKIWTSNQIKNTNTQWMTNSLKPFVFSILQQLGHQLFNCYNKKFHQNQMSLVVCKHIDLVINFITRKSL